MRFLDWLKPHATAFLPASLPGPTVLLTGLPRSGTTLTCALLNEFEDTVALAEPMRLELHGDRARALREIDAFVAATRARALSTGLVESTHRHGEVVDNFAPPPSGDGSTLRRATSEHGLIAVGKPLTPDFRLIVKHPAEFSALTEELMGRYPMAASVRHPLAVLASWQTVEMPVQQGHMPMLEALNPEIAGILAAVPDRLERQIALMGWLLRRYATLFPRENVLRYEDIVAAPRQTLARLTPHAGEPRHELLRLDPVGRYPGVDLPRLATALQAIRAEAEVFYPDFMETLRPWLESRPAPAATPAETAPPAPHRLRANTPRAFVMGAYMANGGALMNYRIGRILAEDFGLQPVAVGPEQPGSSVFAYEDAYPTMDLQEMLRALKPEDVLVASPSFSLFGFGQACQGRKLMYLQRGSDACRVLDAGYDVFVSTSRYVRDVHRAAWGIESDIIPPYLPPLDLPGVPAWEDRPEGSIYVSLKGGAEAFQPALLARLRVALPQARLVAPAEERLPRARLLERIAACRYFLTLAPTEGFGLMPLEAMALGCTVVGFHAFAGLDYMRDGENCAVTGFPDLAGVASRLETLRTDTAQARRLAEAGRATAADPRWSPANFRAAWQAPLARLLGR